jgi:hypothetical protein
MNQSTLTVYVLAINPDGETVLVKGVVPITENNDGDFSVCIANAEKKLTSLCYTVCGSFLATDPAAKLVNLANCVQVFP